MGGGAGAWGRDGRRGKDWESEGGRRYKERVMKKVGEKGDGERNEREAK